MASSTSKMETTLRRMAKENIMRGKDALGETVLHMAASQRCEGSCRFLVEELGFDVNNVSDSGVTPIFYTALEGNVEAMRYLLDHGGDPAMPDEEGTTPLHSAADNGHCEAVRILLSAGVHVDPIDHRGTPLHLAVGKDHDQVVKVLLEHGADANRVVHHILSPLMMAVCGKALKCMRLLIEAGTDVNARGYSGPTPLTEALDRGLSDFVKVFLESGADPNIPNQHGKIPIELAAARGERKLVEILFPRTIPIPSLPDWSVDGIIRTVNSPHINPQAAVSVEERMADLKSQGKAAFGKKDYVAAMYFYGLVIDINPFDATMYANISLCWLRQGAGDKALQEARQCIIMEPGWSKAWYREGAALRFMKDYKGATVAFRRALQLDPNSNEIKEALREVQSMEELHCV